MTIDTTIANSIIKIQEAIEKCNANGIDPPEYLLSQLSDLKIASSSSSNSSTASGGKSTIADFYDVVTSGTGYSVGDLLARVAILDLSGSTPSIAVIWLNLTAGTILGSSPTAIHIERANESVGSRQLGSWAVTASLDVTNANYLSNLNSAIGTAITGAAMPTGGVGWLGWLSAISGYLSSLNSKTPALGSNTAANSSPFTLATDGVFAVFAGLASDAASITGSIHAKLRAIASTLALDTTLQSILAITPNFTKSDISATYMRPTDTSSYVVNDALSNSTSAPLPLTFINVGRVNGGTGYIVNAICYTSQAAFAGALRLYLFKGISEPTATNDNAAFALLAANNANRIGYIDFTSFTTGGTGSDTAISVGAFTQSRLLPFACYTANSNLYGLVEVRTAFTPTSGQTFDFYLGVEQN